MSRSCGGRPQERGARLAELAAGLETPVNGLEGLKAVLEACRALEEGTVQWDLDCGDLEEGFRCGPWHSYHNPRCRQNE